jgi:hypothetical protein
MAHEAPKCHMHKATKCHMHIDSSSRTVRSSPCRAEIPDALIYQSSWYQKEKKARVDLLCPK